LKRIAVLLLFFLFSVGVQIVPSLASAKGLSLIRDAEIENTIRDYATPVFRAAGLTPENINIYLVNDNSLNAFVAGGQNIFIHTGLILKSENAGQIIGVIAHETGHISGGHLSRTSDALSKSSMPAILGVILGGAASLATGRGDVGAAIAAGGSTIAGRSFLKYSRTQEASADHAALKFLDSTKQSAKGMLQFMQFLEDQELLSASSQDPYIQSHPLSRNRIVTIKNHIETSPYSETPAPTQQVMSHARIKAKLHAFVSSPGSTLRAYKKSDTSVASLYARSIARYRSAKIDKALTLLDQLINLAPGDPYFHELRGQILFENARLSESLVSYQKAIDLLPDSFLIRRELARNQIEMDDPALLDTAIRNLRLALPKEPKNTFAWRLLATAYGRKGDIGRSSLALAEEALLQGKTDVAAYQAGRAERIFAEGTREWIQSQDIMLEVTAQRRAKKRK
jgi:predicted Zn-dependent protease